MPQSSLCHGAMTAMNCGTTATRTCVHTGGCLPQGGTDSSREGGKAKARRCSSLLPEELGFLR